MKCIIAGSRYGITEEQILEGINQCLWLDEITEVVSGKAIGVDTIGEKWAKENNIPIKEFYPDWKKYGKSAGVRRNKEMGDYADALICIWDGESNGSKDMLDYAVKKKLRIFLYNLKERDSLLVKIFGE